MNMVDGGALEGVAQSHSIGERSRASCCSSGADIEEYMLAMVSSSKDRFRDIDDLFGMKGPRTWLCTAAAIAESPCFSETARFCAEDEPSLRVVGTSALFCGVELDEYEVEACCEREDSTMCGPSPRSAVSKLPERVKFPDARRPVREVFFRLLGAREPTNQASTRAAPKTAAVQTMTVMNTGVLTFPERLAILVCTERLATLCNCGRRRTCVSARAIMTVSTA